MTLYRFTVPISNYYGDAAFERHLYFEAERCPTKEEVLNVLASCVQDEKEHPEDYYGGSEEQETYDIIQLCQDFPCIYGWLIGANTFVEHPKWGRQPLSCERITPFKIKE